MTGKKNGYVDWPFHICRDEENSIQSQYKKPGDAQAEQESIRRRDSVAFDPSIVTDYYNKEIHDESYKSQNHWDNKRKRKECLKCL